MKPFVDPFRDWRRGFQGPFEKGKQKERHLDGLKRIAAAPPADPGGGEGRGIVVVGGGRYWPGAVVACRMVRLLGCDYPIEVWYRGSCEPVNPADVRGLGVTLIDADAVAARLDDTRVPRGRPESTPGGWENKLYAIVHSAFDQILFLDADAYPVTTPCKFFAGLAHAPFAVWADLPGQEKTLAFHKVWPGGEALNLVPVQGGHLLVDRTRAWPLIACAHWCCEHSDYYFKVSYSEQDQWRAGMAATGIRPHVFGTVRWHPGELVLLADYDGKPAVVHRVRAKMFPGTDGKRDDTLPMEAVAFDQFATVGELPAAPVTAAEAKPEGCCK